MIGNALGTETYLYRWPTDFPRRYLLDFSFRFVFFFYYWQYTLYFVAVRFWFFGFFSSLCCHRKEKPDMSHSWKKNKRTCARTLPFFFFSFLFLFLFRAIKFRSHKIKSGIDCLLLSLDSFAPPRSNSLRRKYRARLLERLRVYLETGTALRTTVSSFL